MDLRCCICILVLSQFVFGSSNDDKSNEVINSNTYRYKLPHNGSLLKADADADPSGKEDETKSSQSLSEEFSKDSEASDGDLLGSEDISKYNDSGSMKLIGHQESSNDNAMVYQWYNGIIPYFVDPESYDKIIVNRIDAAARIIEKESCIKFHAINHKKEVYSYGKYFLHFTNPKKKRECAHRVTHGSEGEPTFVLGYDCMREPDIIHAFMHLLGFRDEVTHPLRDSYIRVLWENIQPKYRHLFTIKNLPQYRELGEYDMMSIMHFHSRAYSINGAPTTVPLAPGGWINPSNQLSLMDKMKLRLAFKHECNRRKVINLLGSCVNSVNGGFFSECSSGSQTDRGALSGNNGASSGSLKDKSGSSSGSDKFVKVIESGEGKPEILIGTDNDKAAALSGTDKDKIETSSETDKDKIEALSGTDTDKRGALSGTDKDKIETSSGTDKDKIEALSGTDTDKRGALSGTDKDKRGVLSGTYKDKRGILSGSDKDKRGVLSTSDADKTGGLHRFKKDKQTFIAYGQG